MVRRTYFQVFQAVLAIVLAGCAIASFFTPLMVGLNPTPRNHLLLHFYDGRTRLFWIEADSAPLSIAPVGAGPDFRIGFAYDLPPFPASLVGVDIPRDPWFTTVTIGGYRNIGSFGGAWRTPFRRWPATSPPPAYSSFVRIPTWLPCLLLLWGPIRAIIRGVRERFRGRRNRCVQCGYHLFGLPMPRCPECGTMIQQVSS